MKTRDNPLLTCGLFLFLIAASGTAVQAAEAAAPPPSPEAVVQAFSEALKAGQYAKSAELMHPEALEKFRSMLLPVVELTGADEEENPLHLFRGVPDVAALKKLSPSEFFAAFMAGLIDAAPGMKGALGGMTTTTVGSVAEGDMVHVVCRMNASAEGITFTKMSVTSVKQSPGGWRLLLSGEMEGIAQTLAKARSAK